MKTLTQEACEWQQCQSLAHQCIVEALESGDFETALVWQDIHAEAHASAETFAQLSRDENRADLYWVM